MVYIQRFVLCQFHLALVSLLQEQHEHRALKKKKQSMLGIHPETQVTKPHGISAYHSLSLGTYYTV